MKSPVLLHMLGIPGAGKTTFLNILKSRWTGLDSPVLLGFDQVMQSLPAYQTMADKVAAFAAFELLARELGYCQLDALITEKKNILFDNGGSAATHVELLRKAQEGGYCVVMVSITTQIDVAKARVDQRAVTEGQHTPMCYLEERAGKLVVLEGDYMALTPYFYRIHNDGMNFSVFQQKCIEVADIILHDLEQKAA